jgi:hypothetical protein
MPVPRCCLAVTIIGVSFGSPQVALEKEKLCGDTPHPGQGTAVPRHPLLKSYVLLQESLIAEFLNGCWCLFTAFGDVDQVCVGGVLFLIGQSDKAAVSSLQLQRGQLMTELAQACIQAVTT